MAEAAEVLRRRGVAAVHEGLVPAEAYQVSLFLGDGARTVFLQDADPCAVKPEKLAAVIRRVRERFPIGRARDHVRAREHAGAARAARTSRCSRTPASRGCTSASSPAPTRC